MQHPTSKAVFEVVERFKSVLPMAKQRHHLKMTECVVQLGDHECGTVHCHGGWYAIACKIHLGRKNYVGFREGANKMAEHFDFSNMWELCEWAESNNQIWGNDNGTGIFSNEDAFYNKIKRPKGAQNLQDIVNHWQEVGERLLALEKQQPIYEDITRELAKFPVNETADQPVKEIA